MEGLFHHERRRRRRGMVGSQIGSGEFTSRLSRLSWKRQREEVEESRVGESVLFIETVKERSECAQTSVRSM